MSGQSRPGQRNCRVTIQSSTRVKQTNGSVITTWSTFSTVWAKLEMLQGSAKLAAQAVWPKADYRITMPYIANIPSTVRVLYNNIIYVVVAINNVDMRNRELVLTCESGVAAS